MVTKEKTVIPEQEKMISNAENDVAKEKKKIKISKLRLQTKITKEATSMTGFPLIIAFVVSVVLMTNSTGTALVTAVESSPFPL